MTVTPPRFISLAAVVLPLLACARLPAHSNTPGSLPRPTSQQLTQHCPETLASLIDPGVDRELWVRPREIFAHPRLGPLVSRALGDRSELELMRRADQVGYDLRTVERALITWSHDNFIAIAISSFDLPTVVERLWNRLLPPRQRATPAEGVTTLRGSLANRSVTVAFEQHCGLVVYAENAPRALDRVLGVTAREGRAPADPRALLRWRALGVASGVRVGPDAGVLARVRAMNLDVDAVDNGLSAVLTLVGPLDETDLSRLRSVARALSQSTLGRLVGAEGWMSSERLVFVRTPTGVRVSALAPWAVVESMSDVFRGAVRSAQEL